MPDNSSKRSPLIVLAVGVLAVSTAALFIRYAQQDGVPSLGIATYRLGLAALMLAPAAVLRHRQEIARLSRREIGFSLLAGTFLAVHFAAWIQSLSLTSVASSVVLVTTTPLWVALAAPWALKEPVSRATAAGLAIALTGGIIVGLSEACTVSAAGLACSGFDAQGSQSLWGNFLALAGAWMAAGYLTAGRQVRSRLSLVAYISLVYGAAAVILLILALVSGTPLLGYAPQTTIWLVLLAIVPQLIGHSAFNWALGYLPAAFVAVALLGEPIGSTILAVLLLGELPSTLEIIGAILILTGIYLTARANTSASKPVPAGTAP